MSRRYISIPEAAEYLGISTAFVRRLIAEGEIKGYRIGSYARHRTIRVDLDEIDEKLMQPLGPYWNDPSARPRKRTNNKPAPDRSTAVTRVEESLTVKKASERKPRRVTLWCKCGHGDGAHGMRTTYGPGVRPPEPRYRCWNCECKQFDEDTERARRAPKKRHG
ncbi:helix-turn-helix domain-containing protein [Mycobacterium sp. Aquia_213]|uniref:helix-turn-helix domain-containing protein n=1 Tax=Mycobacterium sp. Aquia_213 TaxID=2991728 RepID=UPI002D1E38D9|nr:helix-turn-helix domain-containing protein [Mycobacterium sp. Aquia_213]